MLCTGYAQPDLRGVCVAEPTTDDRDAAATVDARRPGTDCRLVSVGCPKDWRVDAATRKVASNAPAPKLLRYPTLRTVQPNMCSAVRSHERAFR